MHFREIYAILNSPTKLVLKKGDFMEFKEFIGKPVISTASKRRFLIYEITSPKICVVTDKPNSSGHYEFYSWPTINGDPFTNGRLIFEDQTLTEKFTAAFDAYSRTEDAYWEEYDYWMRKD